MKPRFLQFAMQIFRKYNSKRPVTTKVFIFDHDTKQPAILSYLESL